MDVPGTTPAEDRIDRPATNSNAYEMFWDCVENDGGDELPPAALDGLADDAYTQFWRGADS